MTQPRQSGRNFGSTLTARSPQSVHHSCAHSGDCPEGWRAGAPVRPHRVRLFEGVRAHPGRGDAARQRALEGSAVPGLTGVVVGRPTAEDLSS